jgi:hypothetical protein
MSFDSDSKKGKCLFAWRPYYPEIFRVLERMLQLSFGESHHETPGCKGKL